MRPNFSTQLHRVLIAFVVILILKVTLSVIAGYRDYLPPNFKSDFLYGRQSYFFGAYQWAFYAHIIAGPLSLILGLALVSDPFRQRFPMWHRKLGKCEVALVLFVLAPSGLWMAYYAQVGRVAVLGFSMLAIATATTMLMGWQTAVNRRFNEHRRWMWRCFLLLSSAVVLRIIGGLVQVTGIGDAWAYPLAAWVSWLVPLAVYETASVLRPRIKRSATIAKRGSVSSQTPKMTSLNDVAHDHQLPLESLLISAHEV